MAPVGIVIVDREGSIIYWNEQATSLFGYSAYEAVGQTLDLIVPEAYRARHWEGFHAAIATNTWRIDRAAQNMPVLCADGAVRTFPARFIFLQDAHGSSIGAMALYSQRTGSEAPWTPVSPGGSQS